MSVDKEQKSEIGNSSSNDLNWLTNELRNGLRTIDWDLEDLVETIGKYYF